MKLSDLVRKIKYLEIKHGADFEIREVTKSGRKLHLCSG